MCRRRSARLATAESWVTMMSVSPRSRQRPSSRSMISSRVSSSRLPGRLVGEQHLAAPSRAPGRSRRAAADRPRARPAGGSPRSPSPTRLERRRRPRRPLGARDAERRERGLDVLLRGERRDQVEALEDEADLLRPDAGELRVAQLRESSVAEHDRARRSAGRARRASAAASTCRRRSGPGWRPSGRRDGRGRRRSSAVTVRLPCV